MNVYEKELAPPLGLSVASPWSAILAIHPRLGLGVYGLFCLLSVLPFLVIDHPPIVDFANHAARQSIACNPTNVDYASMYQYKLGLIPNLALDLINVPLCGSASEFWVVKGTTVAALILIYSAGWFIQRNLFGAPNVFLLALPAMAFNLVTIMGFINFLFGISIGLALVSIVVRKKYHLSYLLLIGNVGGLLIFFSHIFALAFTGLILFGLFLSRAGLNARGSLLAVVQTAAFFALPLLCVPFVASEGGAVPIGYEDKPRLLVALFMSNDAGVEAFGLLLLVPLYMLIRRGHACVSGSMKSR